MHVVQHRMCSSRSTQTRRVINQRVEPYRLQPFGQSSSYCCCRGWCDACYSWHIGECWNCRREVRDERWENTLWSALEWYSVYSQSHGAVPFWTAVLHRVLSLCDERYAPIPQRWIWYQPVSGFYPRPNGVMMQLLPYRWARGHKYMPKSTAHDRTSETCVTSRWAWRTYSCYKDSVSL